MMRWVFGAGALALYAFGQSSTVEETMQAARTRGPALKRLLEANLPNLTQGPNRTGVLVHGQDFLFAAQAEDSAAVVLDGGPPMPLQRVESGSNLWYRIEKMRAGATYSSQFLIGGKPVGQRTDIAGFNPDSYPKPGVPEGKLSGKFTHTSRIYNGMKADFWIYASAGVDPKTPAPLMVWQDGAGMTSRNGGMRMQIVNDNLVAQKLIPPLVHVLIQPGIAPDGKPMRSVQYDTVSDAYARYVMEEILPEVEKHYQLRQDGYSRAIGGASSGAICAFNVAWFMPEKFARVHSTIGSYTSIQWRPQEKLEGGNTYPFKVRKEAKRNIRVWLSDGADDLENLHGSWPLQNIQMANSLKMREYDYHFRFGTTAHNGAQAALDLPESLAWLWRGYDPAKTSEEFTMDPAEKDKPFYRVRITNRDAW